MNGVARIIRVDPLPTVHICCPQPELTDRLATMLAQALTLMATTGTPDDDGEAQAVPVVAGITEVIA